jgi:hypothetical protein
MAGTRRRKLSYTVKEEMLEIVRAWRKSGGKWPAPHNELVDFAMNSGMYNVKARMRRQCARDLSDAMRDDHFMSDGKPIRRLHAVRTSERDEEGKKVQRTFWGDIDTMERPFMAVAFNQRRRQIVGDCRQLSNDIEYRNRRRPLEELHRCLWDFTDDVDEGNESDEYRPRGR